MKRKLSIHDIIVYIILFSFVIVFILPIVGIILTSFKTNPEYLNTNVLQIPESFFNFENFKYAFINGKMAKGFFNTTIILVISLTISILNAATVSYVISRYKTRLTTIVQIMFAGVVMLPSFLMQITTFQIVSDLGLFNTIWAPILLYSGTDIMAIFIFLQFMDNIPKSLDEAAKLDGYNSFQIFFKVILPLLKPAVVTVAITKGIAIYNDFYIPFLYLPKQSKLTISTTLFKFSGPYGAQWEIISAGILIIMIPTFVIFILLQKHIYNGLAGGVKE